MECGSRQGHSDATMVILPSLSLSLPLSLWCWSPSSGRSPLLESPANGRVSLPFNVKHLDMKHLTFKMINASNLAEAFIQSKRYDFSPPLKASVNQTHVKDPKWRRPTTNTDSFRDLKKLRGRRVLPKRAPGFVPGGKVSGANPTDQISWIKDGCWGGDHWP